MKDVDTSDSDAIWDAVETVTLQPMLPLEETTPARPVNALPVKSR